MFCFDVDVAMAVARVDGHFIDCNYPFEQLTGYTRKELLQTNMFALTHPQDLPKIFACVRGMLARKYTLCKAVKKWVQKNGELFACSCVISVVSNPTTGAPKYFVCFGPSTLEDESVLESEQEVADAVASELASSVADDAVLMSPPPPPPPVVKQSPSPISIAHPLNDLANNASYGSYSSNTLSRVGQPSRTFSSPAVKPQPNLQNEFPRQVARRNGQPVSLGGRSVGNTTEQSTIRSQLNGPQQIVQPGGPVIQPGVDQRFQQTSYRQSIKHAAPAVFQSVSSNDSFLHASSLPLAVPQKLVEEPPAVLQSLSNDSFLHRRRGSSHIVSQPVAPEVPVMHPMSNRPTADSTIPIKREKLSSTHLS